MSACTELAASASAGAGPALAAVDCLSNEMAASAFGRLFGSQGALLPALTILLTLYIAIFAFSLITGRSRLGVSVLTPRMMTLGLVLTFATSWMAWQQVVWNLAIGAPDQLAGILMGSEGSATRMFADRIDMIVGAIAEVGTQGAQGGQGAANAAQQAGGAGAFSPQGLMWLGALLLLLGTVGVLVTARIALAVLLATGPIFVIMALFGPTRGLTAGWLRGVLLTAITPLFVTVGGSLMLELAVPVVAALRGMEGQVDPRAAMALFLIAAVHAALMTMMLKVAGTMAAAWSVFGLAADKDDDRRGGTSAATPMPPAEAMPVSPAVASSAAAARSRTAALIPASTAFEGAPAAAASSGGTSVQRTHIIQSGPDQNGLPSLPRNRARGVGSRFASPRTSLRKEMIR